MTEADPAEPQRREPVFRVPDVVLAFVAVLAAIHLALVLGGPEWQVLSLYLFSFIPARLGGDGAFPHVAGSQVWSFLTYALLHGGWVHLISNSLWLVVFGTIVARRLPAWRFLALSAISAIAGAVAMLIVYWGQDTIVVGASAAVSGLMAAAIPIMYARNIRYADLQSRDLRTLRVLQPGELLRDRRALFFAGVWFFVTLLTGASGFLGNSFAEAGRIAWEAHIGGFIAGFAAFYLLDRQRVLPEPRSW